MATMTIRNIDDQLKARLRIQAAHHGCSMEDEARNILRAALSHPTKSRHLIDSIRARVQEVPGGADIELPEREPIRKSPEFEK